jgi:radical SAM superfamily enzyme YgiQ (UPF0313 family)
VVGRNKGGIFYGKADISLLKPTQIPLPDYSLINNNNIKYNRAEIITTRGCPFNCSYCSVNNALGNSIRYRNGRHFFEEINNHIYQRGFDFIHILDDNFGLSKKRFLQFINKFSARYPNIAWSCYHRIIDMDISTIDLMVKSGCRGVYTGIEPDDGMKSNNGSKIFNKDAILERIRYASKFMNITGSIIWGFPNENLTQFKEKLELIDEILNFENVFVNIYQLAPLSGTRILNDLKNRLIFDEERISGFIYPPYLSPLTADEKILIKENPVMFSAFYHEDTREFDNKFKAVNKFIGNDKQYIKKF